MKQKVVVLGSRGMLGHLVLAVLGGDSRLDTLGIGRRSNACGIFFDVENAAESLNRLEGAIGNIDYIINCIGITANQIDENNPESARRAMVVNAFFPQEMARWARNKKTKILSISSDGVFENNGGRFFEDSPIAPEDVYGRSKALGEVVENAVLNIRCSIIGPSPHNHRSLYEWVNQHAENSVIKGYTNHFWNGITTLEYAEFCRRIILKDLFKKLRKKNHVFHLAPRAAVSKYELLVLLKNISGKKLDIVPVKNGENSKGRILKTKYSIMSILLPKINLEEALKMLKIQTKKVNK